MPCLHLTAPAAACCCSALPGHSQIQLSLSVATVRLVQL
jgi:hypothetical protein